jgi:hypothetical protein
MTKAKFNTFKEIQNYHTFLYANLWHFVTPTKTTKKVLSRILAFRQINTTKLTEYGKN